MNLHQILHWAWTFLYVTNHSDDSEEHSYGQLVIGNFITTQLLVYQSCLGQFFGKTSNPAGDSASLQPRFGTVWLLAFPIINITFEREEIWDHRWDSGKYNGAADGYWENCVRSQSAYFEENWGIIVLCTMFLVSCIFFGKCLYFSYYMAGYLLDRSCISYLSRRVCSRVYQAVEISF